MVAAACATPSTRPVGPTQAGSVPRVDTIRVPTESAADAALEEQVGLLQIQLLERDARLANMQEQLDAIRQEVVRNLAKLQSQASRAEAASGMAEAEIALETLGRVDGGNDLAEFAQAGALIAESSAEFSNENYGGAVYLASQARALARSGQSRVSGAGAGLRPGETLFATPVPLWTAQRSNVRRGPGLNFDVDFTLDEATPLVGQSYTSQWVRAVDDQGREGWIFHTLVTARAR
jgi:hypothetical protein